MMEDVIHELAPLHQIRLRNIQKPIFEELENAEKKITILLNANSDNMSEENFNVE